MAQAGQSSRAVRIDDRRRCRKLFVGLVMIDDESVETELLRLRHNRVARRTAIHGYQKRCAALRERADRVHIGSVALEDAVGNMNDRIEAAGAQHTAKHRSRSRSVDIVVAEDRDSLAAHHGIGHARSRRIHVRERRGIGHQRLDARIEKRCRTLRRDAASGQHARQQLRHRMPLRNGERLRLPARIEPVAPELPVAERSTPRKQAASARASGSAVTSRSRACA